MSASDISEKIDLSRTTVMKIVEYFLDKGLVMQSGKGVSTEEGGICIDKVSKVCRMLLDQARVAASRLIGIAIGSHGVTNSSKGIVLTSPHFPSWGNDIPIKDLLLQKLDFKVPVLVDNQIRFQAFAEQTRRRNSLVYNWNIQYNFNVRPGNDHHPRTLLGGGR